MNRTIRFRAIAFWSTIALVLFVFLDVASADNWPSTFDVTGGEPEKGEHYIKRGPGGYFNWLKFYPVILIYFLWIKTTDWVNRDCQTLNLPYATWNAVVFFPFIIGMGLMFTVPIFFGGLAALLLFYFVPLGIYIGKRNSVVDPHQRVLTPSHIRHVFSRQAKTAGFDVDAEGKAAHEKGAPVKFASVSGSNHKRQANEIAARQGDGYQGAKTFVVDAIEQRCEKVMLDYAADGVTVKFQIDGVWHEADPQDRESGDNILAVFKNLANMKVEERVKRQSGIFDSEYKGTKYKSTLISQGTKTGERVILQLDPPTSSFESMDHLGMRPKMVEQLTELLAQEQGFVLFSSAPTNGLTTTLSVALRLTDRFMRDFVALQDVKSPEPLAENIDLTTWDTSKNETPEKVLLSLVRKEPDGIIVNELPNAETVRMLCEQAINEKMIISTIRAKEAVEALLRVLLLKVQPSAFADAVTAVVNQKLIRKLCENCKEAYEPAPALLQKLGIPAGRIESLYRPPDPAEQQKPCPDCNGIGYFGRTAIFELLVVNDSLRQALVKKPKLDVLRDLAKKSGHRNVQQEGIVLVAKGVTSLAELSRVLKQ